MIDLSTLNIGDKVKLRSGEIATYIKYEKQNEWDLYPYKFRIDIKMLDNILFLTQTGRYWGTGENSKYDCIQILKDIQIPSDEDIAILSIML